MHYSSCDTVFSSFPIVIAGYICDRSSHSIALCGTVSLSRCRNSDKELQRTQSHVARANGKLWKRFQQPRRWFVSDTTTATVTGVMWPAVRDNCQRETSQSGGSAIPKLRLQVSDIRRRLRCQIRSYIHERYVWPPQHTCSIAVQ